MSARRFLWRWSARVVRREWRQHLVIFWLIVSGVALSVSGVLAAYHLVETPEADFGNGQFAATSEHPAQLEEALAASGRPYGRIDSATVQVTGSTQRTDVRAVDPTNHVTAPLVELLDGDWPNATPAGRAVEVAVTDRAVIDAHTIGDTFELAGNTVTVVGVVENPNALSDEFVVAAALDPFAAGVDVSTQFLVDADPGSIELRGVRDFSVSTTDGPPIRTVLTLVVNVVSALGMLEIALLVGAAFAVIARRRTRQFGLLASSGATPRHIRSAATAVGTIVGVAGAVVGFVVGIVVAVLLIPAMETTVDHRIDFTIPWLSILPSAVLAIAAGAVGACWPSRALSNFPVAHLLASMRPRPAPVGRAALLGAIAAVLGATALALGFARFNIYLALLGVVVAPIGLLLASPLLVESIGRFSAGLPLTSRIAGRAIGRHNRRSAAVVSALALALAIPIGVAVVSSSIDQRSESLGPNLPDTTFIAWQPGADDGASRLPLELDPTVLTATRERIARAVPELSFVELKTAVRRDGPREVWDFSSIGSQQSVGPILAGRRGASDCFACDSYGFGESDADGNEITYIVEDTWLASPELLDTLGIDSAWLATAPAIAKSDDFKIVDVEGVLAPDQPVAVDSTWPVNSRIPPLLVSPESVLTDDYDIVDIGWLVTADSPITAEQRDLVRDVVGPDLILEFHAEPRPQSALRAIGLILGLLVGLGIALSAVGLFTAELGNDLRILSSVGASPRTSRRLSASVAGMLAAAGALIAIVIGYLPLIPLLTAKEIDFPFVVPWQTLGVFLAVFPLLAAGAGWLAAPDPAKTRGSALL